MCHTLRLTAALFITLLLISCSSQRQSIFDDQAVDQAIDSETGSYRFSAWRLSNSGEFEAINVLLNEVDELIERHGYNAAADKLERILRIKPHYAPAWSRLSWLALQMDLPKRSVQMAKRSNSFAVSDPELQSLNWMFIRNASKVLNDDDAYFRANQKIESLKSF